MTTTKITRRCDHAGGGAVRVRRRYGYLFRAISFFEVILFVRGPEDVLCAGGGQQEEKFCSEKLLREHLMATGSLERRGTDMGLFVEGSSTVTFEGPTGPET